VSDLVRTLILCGLLSGTQPVTVMGLLLVMSGGHGSGRRGAGYLAGAFVAESLVLLFAALVIGSTVDDGSSPGRLFYIIRIVLGVVLVAAGLRLRTPPKEPPPAIPKALEKLQGLGPGKAFVAGAMLADYQGPFVASLVLASTTVDTGGRLAALLLYTLFATGIPFVIFLVTLKSQRALAKMNASTTWVMGHRRQLASWFAIVFGIFLLSDALIGLLL
jgi:hypothetical protein